MEHLPVAEKPRRPIGRKTPPLDPGFDGGLVKAVEDIRWQFDVARRAVEIEDAAGRRRLGTEGTDVSEQNDREPNGGEETPPGLGMRQSSGALAERLENPMRNPGPGTRHVRKEKR